MTDSRDDFFRYARGFSTGRGGWDPSSLSASSTPSDPDPPAPSSPDPGQQEPSDPASPTPEPSTSPAVDPSNPEPTPPPKIPPPPDVNREVLATRISPEEILEAIGTLSASELRELYRRFKVVYALNGISESYRRMTASQRRALVDEILAEQHS